MKKPWQALEKHTQLRFRTLQVANCFSERLCGLTQYESHPKGLAFALPHCKLVHTFGMHYSIDLLFVDRNFRVIKICEQVPANAIRGAMDAKHTIELEANVVQQQHITLGDRLCADHIALFSH